MSLAFILALCSCAATLYVTLAIVIGLRRMGDLGRTPPFAGPEAPLVSIIVAARNEEKTIEPALLSLLHQDYRNIEIIVINDRSTDDTREVLRRIQRQHPELQVYEIRDLAAGWLGKTHAVDFGAARATGEYLVFTDADVIMKKSTIGRAVARMRRGRLDHLSLMFKNIAQGWILNSMVIDAAASIMLLFRPWAVRDPRSRYFIGIGAFNMVRTEAYRAVGGHRMIRMHPIDDIMLGKILKRYGCRQECLIGYDFVSVRWYDTVEAMIEGLSKNAFALMNFSVARTLAVVGLIVVLNMFPPWGILVCDGPARLFFLAAVSLRLFLSLACCRAMKVSSWNVAGTLISQYINCYAALRSAYMAVKNGGIRWRGTEYPLEKLKRCEPVLSPIHGKE